MKKIITIITIITVILLSAKSAHAQQISLSLYPPIIETIIKPGKNILVAYTVTNNGDPATLRFNMRTFSPQGVTGAMNISDDLEGPVRFSLDNNDLQLGQPFLLRTGSYRQAIVRMRIPEGTPDGDYYYVLLAETESTPGINGSSGSISRASVGSPLLVTVTQSGKVQIKGSIESMYVSPRYKITLFDTTYNIFDSSDPVLVHLTLKNEGNNLFKPEGTISLSGGLGETMSRAIIPQNILSDSSRAINCSPHCSFSGFFIGTYDINASVRLNEKQSPLRISTRFIAIPFKFILGLFVVIIITLSILIKGKKKQQKKDQYL